MKKFKNTSSAQLWQQASTAATWALKLEMNKRAAVKCKNPAQHRSFCFFDELRFDFTSVSRLAWERLKHN